MRMILWLVSLVVPHLSRDRWREEWTAELKHGGWRMLPGALPDALAMRRVASVSAEAGSSRRHPFHALDQDFSYAVRALRGGRSSLSQ